MVRFEICFQRGLKFCRRLIAIKVIRKNEWTAVGEYQQSKAVEMFGTWMKKTQIEVEINLLVLEKMSHQRATCFPWIKIGSLMKPSGRTRIRTLKISNKMTAQ